MVSSQHQKGRKRFLKRQETRFLVEEAVTYCIEEGLKNRLTDPLRSQEMFHLARKIGKRARIHLPRKYRLLFCRSCYYPFSIKTARIRLNSKKKQIHYLCLNCKKEQRYGYFLRRKNIEKD